MGLPRWLSGKELTCQYRRHKRREFHPWVGKIPWKRAWQPTPVFLPGESLGQRSLVGSNPWGHRVIHNCSDLARTLESDRLPLHREVTGVGSFLTSLQGLTMLLIHTLYLGVSRSHHRCILFFLFSSKNRVY